MLTQADLSVAEVYVLSFAVLGNGKDAHQPSANTLYHSTSPPTVVIVYFVTANKRVVTYNVGVFVLWMYRDNLCLGCVRLCDIRFDAGQIVTTVVTTTKVGFRSRWFVCLSLLSSVSQNLDTDFSVFHCILTNCSTNFNAKKSGRF